MSKTLALVAVVLTFAVLAAGIAHSVSTLKTAQATSAIRLDELPSEVQVWFR